MKKIMKISNNGKMIKL